MSERLSNDARELLSRAVWEAREAGAHQVEPEHLLVALINGTGTPAGVLQDLGLDMRAVAEIRPHSEGPHASEFARATRDVLERALREALALGHSRIDSDHILLALVGEPDESVVRVFRRAHVPPIVVRQRLAREWEIRGRPSDDR